MDSEWEFLKQVIRDVYLVRDQTLEVLINEMGVEHGFWKTSVKALFELFSRWRLTANSKSQYERAFKVWNFRKNLTKEQWAVVSHKLNKRKRDEKDSEVLVDGILLEEKKLRKETKRYRPMPSNAIFHSGS